MPLADLFYVPQLTPAFGLLVLAAYWGGYTIGETYQRKALVPIYCYCLLVAVIQMTGHFAYGLW